MRLADPICIWCASADVVRPGALQASSSGLAVMMGAEGLRGGCGIEVTKAGRLAARARAMSSVL
jgi:hypothetical protein